MAGSELSKRVAVAAAGIPLVVVALVLGRWAMGPVLALFCAAAALEFYRLTEQRGVRPFRWAGALSAAGLVLVATFLPGVTASAPILWVWTVALGLGLAVAAIWARGPDAQPMASVAVTLLGAVVPAGALSHAIYLRHLPVEPAAPATAATATLVGVALVAFPLAVTWMTDSAAFFAGKRWGRRRLIPRVSPGKTVEGAVAGLMGGLLGGWLVAHLVLGWWLQVPLNPVAGALAGLVVSGFSQVGDLAESLWKREAGVKDSGSFFPGHGGVLDRMDSLLFTVPASYWLLAWLVHGVSPW
jgi:phosphatidate cytidylyltransferase